MKRSSFVSLLLVLVLILVAACQRPTPEPTEAPPTEVAPTEPAPTEAPPEAPATGNSVVSSVGVKHVDPEGIYLRGENLPVQTGVDQHTLFEDGGNYSVQFRKGEEEILATIQQGIQWSATEVFIPREFADYEGESCLQACLVNFESGEYYEVVCSLQFGWSGAAVCEEAASPPTDELVEEPLEEPAPPIEAPAPEPWKPEDGPPFYGSEYDSRQGWVAYFWADANAFTRGDHWDVALPPVPDEDLNLEWQGEPTQFIPRDNWVVLFQRTVNLTFGNYRVHAMGDDGLLVYVIDGHGGRLIHNSWTEGESGGEYEIAELSGEVTFVLVLWERDGPGKLRFRYELESFMNGSG